MMLKPIFSILTLISQCPHKIIITLTIQSVSFAIFLPTFQTDLFRKSAKLNRWHSYCFIPIHLQIEGPLKEVKAMKDFVGLKKTAKAK